MKRITLLLVAVATVASVVVFTATTSRHVTAQEAGNTSHFHWAKSGAYIAQVTAIGPLGFEYVNSKDDPRNENSTR